jgi:glycosyltransferase involved in cell wall biosynthesis
MKKYQDSLPAHCNVVFATGEKADSFHKDHQHITANSLPVFTPYTSVKCKTGIGNFCLYHGDLADPCNEKAVLWLLSKVYNDINTPLVIAGKNPGKQIEKLAEFYNHTCLIINPSQSEMDDLIAKAHINVLPSFSHKRPEFKLVHALLEGRHCITNENAVKGTELQDACHVGTNATAFKSLILQLYHRPFEEEEIELRKKIFNSLQQEKPVNTLIHWLFE